MANNQGIKRSVTLDDVSSLLNELIKIDPWCMHRLFEARVACNKTLADHPTVQVQPGDDNRTWEVGILGILNGLFGVDELFSGAFAGVYSDDTLEAPGKLEFVAHKIAGTVDHPEVAALKARIAELEAQLVAAAVIEDEA